MKPYSRRGASPWRCALAAIGIGASLCVASASAPAAAADEEVIRAGDYLLRTRILHAGTRSEGRVGRLYRDGAEVQGRTLGESIVVVTPTGAVRFTYMGEARLHLWSISGWTDRAPN